MGEDPGPKHHYYSIDIRRSHFTRFECIISNVLSHLLTPTVSCMREHEPGPKISQRWTYPIFLEQGTILPYFHLVLSALHEHDAFQAYRASPEMEFLVQAAHPTPPCTLTNFRFSQRGLAGGRRHVSTSTHLQR
jgi:hypothetical protein